MERVLAVRRTDFFDGSWPQGFQTVDRDAGRALVEGFERAAIYLDRGPAEEDPSHKQLIPYCAVQCEDRLFTVERLTAQGEARLHGKLSVGIGGHINPVDGEGSGTVQRALSRELDEELELPDRRPAHARLIGLLNDDSNPVGSVHVGLVYLLAIPTGEEERVRVREIDRMRGHFRRLVGSGSLWQDPDRLETWSRILVGELAEGMAGSGTSEHNGRKVREDRNGGQHRETTA